MGQSVLHLGSQGMTAFGTPAKQGEDGQSKIVCCKKRKTEKKLFLNSNVLYLKASNVLIIKSRRQPIATVFTTPAKSPAMAELTSLRLAQGLECLGLVAGTDLTSA